MAISNPLIVALDRSSRDELLRLADHLAGVVGVLKIGLQAFIANGPDIVEELCCRGSGIFLDLKLHDIPNTVANAVDEARGLNVDLLTLHTSGGRVMMEAAAKKKADGRPLLLGVTVLTSLADEDIEEIGFRSPVNDRVRELALLARESGLDGVVASPREIRMLRDTCGPEFLIVTPGIRSPGDDQGDQVRTMSARDAIEAGADYIVVGRPITDAARPRESALRILDEVSSANANRQRGH